MGRLNLNTEDEELDSDKIQEELNIDLYNLHLEAQKQGGLVRKYSRMMVEKKQKYEQEKMKTKVIEFEIAKEIKKNPKSFGLTDPKVTDTMLKLAIPSSKQWQIQFKKQIKAEGEYEDYKNIVEAVKMKSYDIKVAFELWSSNYYGDLDLKRKELK
jgi:hypothetical protein